MWIFGYNKKKKACAKPPSAVGSTIGGGGWTSITRPTTKVVYALTTGSDDLPLLFESAHDAIVEASRLCLVTSTAGDDKVAVRATRLHCAGAAASLSSTPPPPTPGIDLSRRLALAELPAAARRSVEAHIETQARLSAERDVRAAEVSAAVGAQWDALLVEYRAKEARCEAAKAAAKKSYVNDRGFTTARVREICDANDMALQLSRDLLMDRGDRLVRAAGESSAYPMSLDDMFRRDLLAPV